MQHRDRVSFVITVWDISMLVCGELDHVKQCARGIKDNIILFKCLFKQIISFTLLHKDTVMCLHYKQGNKIDF